ncbi:MAG TPA: 4-hydroxy-tetrahydrodipicolinate reductase [Myxococcaceae bacterium]|nr:4-hydroxy-tetrahydrodipicolinate reductase [Myxococcaceae bacterium]
MGRTRVILAGATGWAGSELARGIAADPDLQLVGAVSRTHAGARLGEVVGDARLECAVSGSVREVLRTPGDVFFEYTRPEVAKAHVVAALGAGAHVVIGTSGLTEEDFQEIDQAARAARRGVLAVGNFALTVVVLQRLAQIAARFFPHYEIVDSAHDDKPDAPSGTARQLARQLAAVRPAEITVPLDRVQGPREARGASVAGVQVHSVRLPGYVIGLEVVFGRPGERLHLRHESGTSAQPYVAGALLAIRKVSGLVGLHRGLEGVIDWDVAPW